METVRQSELEALRPDQLRLACRRFGSGGAP